MQAPRGDKIKIWRLCRFTQAPFCLHINGRVHIIYILPIQFLPQKLDGFAETLEMNDLPLPQESDDVIDIRIVADAQDVVISDASFLL